MPWRSGSLRVSRQAVGRSQAVVATPCRRRLRWRRGRGARTDRRAKRCSPGRPGPPSRSRRHRSGPIRLELPRLRPRRRHTRLRFHTGMARPGLAQTRDRLLLVLRRKSPSNAPRDPGPSRSVHILPPGPRSGSKVILLSVEGAGHPCAEAATAGTAAADRRERDADRPGEARRPAGAPAHAGAGSLARPGGDLVVDLVRHPEPEIRHPRPGIDMGGDNPALH